MAKNTFGTILKLGTAGGALTAVAKLTNIEPGEISREMQDATTHDSADGATEVIPEGVYTNGELQIEGDWIMGSVDEDRIVAAIQDGTLMDYELIGKAATGTETEAGSCYISNYKRGALGVKGKQGFSCTLTPTGVITQAATV